MQKTLIIKTGAAGDVVRTTSLLNVLHGNITWLVEEKNKSLFPDQLQGLQLITDIDSALEELKTQHFDIVLSLEEDRKCARLARTVSSKKLVGIYLDDEKLNYNSDSEGWYDMSLISKKGRDEANALKKTNPFPFQYWLFKMIGKEFSSEPYVVYKNPSIKRARGLIGIESRSGDTWPNKAWGGYYELIGLIKKEGYQVKTFSQRGNLRDYLDDIAGCSFIISGDTLTMHIALAYQIPCISIFNCTPPNEIHDYGLLTKIISPFLNQNLYSRKYDEQAANAVSVKEVFNAFQKLSLPK
jgi:lipopolysaccharide heptosyltransferase II